MPALLINLKIELPEKFDCFKVTLSDLTGLFEECHIKIRGKYSKECVEYAKTKLGKDTYLYQELQQRDWIAATLEMLGKVRSRSVFIYFEDHKLIAGRERLEHILLDFDKYELDYLCYSFFKASQLDVKNLLPLGVVQRQLFDEFTLSTDNLNLIGKISPGYYTFSLVSLVSVNYLRGLLLAENKKFKIFARKVTSLLIVFFPYPRYRSAFKKINNSIASLGTKLCIYPPASPFNLEKIWFESALPKNGSWKFGIIKQELYANYDDDNGAYAESLIKKGLYPFDPNSVNAIDANCMNDVVRQLVLGSGEIFDCTYFSHNGRINCPPLVEISVTRGSIVVLYKAHSYSLSTGDVRAFYSNLGPVIHCVEPSEIKLKVFDEIL